MGKKRKAGGRYGASKEPVEENSKLAINGYEDVADSEDEFHINRDKILLDDGPTAKKMRKWREEGQYRVLEFGRLALLICASRRIAPAFRRRGS